MGMTALEHLRRRARAVAWAMMPVLAVAWLNASLACVGMDSQVAVERSPAVKTHDHRAHDPADHAAGDAHTRAYIDDLTIGDATPRHPEALHDHVSCPHCPTSIGTAGTAELNPDHVICGVADSVALPSTHSAQWDLKPFLSPIVWIASVRNAAPDRRARHAAYAEPAPHPRSLNHRYCVLLL